MAPETSLTSSNSLFDLLQRPFDFFEPRFDAEVAVDPFLHHEVDGKLHAVDILGAQHADAPPHASLIFKQAIGRKGHKSSLGVTLQGSGKVVGILAQPFALR